MKVLVICINYNSYDQTGAYLMSIDKAASNANVSVDVIVVDNSDKKQVIKNVFSNIRIKHIFTNANLGYFGAVKYGVEKSSVVVSDYDYSIISNVDLLMTENFLKRLDEKKYKTNVGCIAPSIISKTENKDRNPKIISRPSKKKLTILKWMYAVPGVFDLYTLFYYNNRKKTEYVNGLKIFAPHGSFILFTKNAAEFVQNINYRTFLFCEENYVGENLKMMNLLTIYDKSLRIIDKDHQSTGKIHRRTYYNWNKEAITNLLEDYYE